MPEYRRCEIDAECETSTTNRCRGCGAATCDEHCDKDTELCMFCVPVDERSYAEQAWLAGGGWA